MASELKVDKFTGVTTAGSIDVQGEGTATTNLQQGLAKAWVNFKMAASFVTNDSLNVASITDNGTGNGTVNINNDMNNDDYCVTVSAQSINILNLESSQAAGLFQILTYNSSVTATDYQVSASVQGDLA